VDWLPQSINFGNLLESNQTFLAKENLFLITCSTSVQINKNYGGQQVFILRVQTDQINSVSRHEFFFQDLDSCWSLFEIQYLLWSWELVYAYHPDHSTVFGDHHGAFLICIWALIDLQSGVQVAYLSIIHPNHFS
jgi:hypothetical protein